MSTFILFKKDDVDPLLRKIFKPKDVPEGFKDRVEIDGDNVIVDHRRSYKRGITFSFHNGRILPGSPLLEYYYPTPLGFVKTENTFTVIVHNGSLFTIVQEGRLIHREPISIDDPMFDEALVYVHSVNKVFTFREYYKENLLGK